MLKVLLFACKCKVKLIPSNQKHSFGKKQIILQQRLLNILNGSTAHNT